MWETPGIRRLLRFRPPQLPVDNLVAHVDCGLGA
uniref:Uncharacterized protein n=1 Tax=Siphoviridae sp. ctpyK9 TaxID=2825679 RepID=A0A8S5UU60_9CAUD|nr:MAG TPA: hypothetical protein [Siphoviridae sp. ctpyK9]